MFLFRKSHPMQRRSSGAPRRSRPQLEMLEDRVVPAFDLSISTATTANVSNVLASGTRTFTATSSGANVNVVAIQTSLAAGENVVVATGNSGTEPGDIDWDAAADMNISSIMGVRSLKLQADPSGTSRAISVAADITGSPALLTNLLAVEFNSGAAVGSVTVSGALTSQGINSVKLVGGSVTVNSTINSVESVDITASTVTLNAGINIVVSSLFGGGSATVTGDVTVATTSAIGIAGFAMADSIAFTGNLVLAPGANLSLFTLDGSITHKGGVLDIGTNTLTIGDPATELDLGGALPSTLVGTGTVAGSLRVGQNGTISPGGSAASGTMNVTGNVAFQNGSKFLADFGATSDLLSVDGSVTIAAGSSLAGSGATVNTNPISLITTTGTLTGSFDGTGTPFLLGSDLVAATYTASSPGQLTIKQSLGGPKTVTLPTSFGDLARFRLLGGGAATLIAADDDQDGIIDLVRIRKPTAKNVLQITVLPNGGPGTVQVSQIIIEGAIGGIDAATMMLIGSGSSSILNVTGKLGRMTALTLENGDVNVGSAGPVKAQSISSVNFVATGRVAGLSANDIVSLDMTATSLGTLSVKRSAALGLFGDLTAAVVTLTGQFGAQKDGLTKVAVDGCVEGCVFNVQGGSVGSFICGMFCDSQLYVGYTPPMSGDFNDLGTFSTTNRTIRTFRTTVVPNAFATPAFEDSQVVAAKLGTVQLSSVELNNGTVAFGLRVKNGVPKNVGSVRIANTPPFNAQVNYKPSATGDVVPSVGGLGAQGDFRFFG